MYKIKHIWNKDFKKLRGNLKRMVRHTFGNDEILKNSDIDYKNVTKN